MRVEDGGGWWSELSTAGPSLFCGMCGHVGISGVGHFTFTLRRLRAERVIRASRALRELDQWFTWRRLLGTVRRPKRGVKTTHKGSSYWALRVPHRRVVGDLGWVPGSFWS